jgi:hypothetical protein
MVPGSKDEFHFNPVSIDLHRAAANALRRAGVAGDVGSAQLDAPVGLQEYGCLAAAQFQFSAGLDDGALSVLFDIGLTRIVQPQGKGRIVEQYAKEDGMLRITFHEPQGHAPPDVFFLQRHQCASAFLWRCLPIYPD